MCKIYEENYIILMNKIKEELEKVEKYSVFMHTKHQCFQAVSSQLAINGINAIPVVGEQNSITQNMSLQHEDYYGQIVLSHKRVSGSFCFYLLTAKEFR